MGRHWKRRRRKADEAEPKLHKVHRTGAILEYIRMRGSGLFSSAEAARAQGRKQQTMGDLHFKELLKKKPDLIPHRFPKIQYPKETLEDRLATFYLDRLQKLPRLRLENRLERIKALRDLSFEPRLNMTEFRLALEVEEQLILDLLQGKKPAGIKPAQEFLEQQEKREASGKSKWERHIPSGILDVRKYPFKNDHPGTFFDDTTDWALRQNLRLIEKNIKQLEASLDRRNGKKPSLKRNRDQILLNALKAVLPVMKEHGKGGG